MIDLETAEQKVSEAWERLRSSRTSSSMGDSNQVGRVSKIYFWEAEDKNCMGPNLFAFYNLVRTNEALWWRVSH
jgi:hypothetical protein